MKVVNLDHYNTLPGGVGEPWDRAIVLSDTAQDPHVITGIMQPRVLFRGTLAGAHRFIEAGGKKGNAWA